ncbi:MAG: hypothetical protein MZV70_32260 [Desulfobacterales bacterium]|nr:hypothetical protein [Desulfobacterales bacterium]
MMVMTSFLEDKERAVHFGIVIHIHGRHSDGFETYCVAAIGELCLMGNIEVLTEKTIDERSALFAVCHPLILAPYTSRAPKGYV